MDVLAVREPASCGRYLLSPGLAWSLVEVVIAWPGRALNASVVVPWVRVRSIPSLRLNGGLRRNPFQFGSPCVLFDILYIGTQACFNVMPDVWCDHSTS